MVQTQNKLLAFLGWNVTGDMGPWTFYTDAQRNIVWFARVPALNPASATQATMRLRWTLAAAAWRMQTPATRNNWELASKRAHLRITGYDLWVHWITVQDRPTILTVGRQAGITLLM